jgi:actin-related protein 5
LYFPRQNTAAVSSDEEEEYNQLQIIENKLLMHDPTFTTQHTHASITSQRSALISAFRPQYEEGDIEGWIDVWLFSDQLLIATNNRHSTDTSEHGTMARV